MAQSDNRDVFISCPFESDYTLIFQAICFTVLACGYRPLCAIGSIYSGRGRLVPRFDIPFELGLFLGCRRFRADGHRAKRTVILDRDRCRRFLSDISGQEREAQSGISEIAIDLVRAWRRSTSEITLPMAIWLKELFGRFRIDLPGMYEEIGYSETRLPFSDLIYLQLNWMESEAAANP